ncbi:GDSL-type esterase/lipase family protein [Mycoplasma struthionis]|uniref:SGNH/GDSL hydrolase family protein n=1 Tax=Mycoplasma struthionis TaxID=538220 RepID=A0A502M7K7_9MOLU|nr:GDSL-type esterase/lipase family protein [Mycoplasma struthionis]TPI01932.1 hypothetical protein FJM01_01580 [Mycoplasma struthionis]
MKKQFQPKIQGDVNYIAIGDDYAVGKNNSDNWKFFNRFETNTGIVKGISYPSYFANALRTISDDKTQLVTYENEALINATVEDWLYLLNPNSYSDSSKTQRLIAYNENLDYEEPKKESFPFNLRASTLQAKIEDANFITISLGLNDIFKDDFSFDNLISLLGSNKNKKEIKQTLENWVASSNRKMVLLEENYRQLIKDIKKINPKVNITLVGYLKPYLKLAQIIKNEYGQDYLEAVTNQLNATIRSVAFSETVNYASFSDEKEISEDVDKYALNVFDYLPSNNAYKKLGQDLFMKLSLSEKDYDSLVGKNVNDSDYKAYEQVFEFETLPSEIKSNILGLSGANVDTFTKEYSFESLDAVRESISSEFENNYTINYLKDFKTYLNNGKNFSAEELLRFGDRILSFFWNWFSIFLKNQFYY